MKTGFDDLESEAEWRHDERERAEAAARKRARESGGPERRRLRRVSQADLDAAAAEWS